LRCHHLLPSARRWQVAIGQEVRGAGHHLPHVRLEWSASRALAAGATDEEITGVLLVVGPVIGLDRIVRAAPGVAGALGYDIDTALESRSGH